MTLFAVLLLPTLFVVDAANGPGTTHTSLGAALAVAQAGDTVVVRAGSYSASTLPPGVTVRGAGANLVTVVGDLSLMDVNNLPNSHLAGLTCTGSILVQFGRLTLDHCVVRGSSSAQGGIGALAIVNGHVSASRCTFRGGDLLVPPTGGSGTAGTAVSISFFGTFTANECQLRGGDCIVPATASVVSSFGGAGLATNQGSAELRGGSVRGGDNSAHDGISFGGYACDARLAGHVTIAGDATMTVLGGSGPTTGESIRGTLGSVVTVHGPVVVSPAAAAPVTVGAPELPRLAVNGSVLADGSIDSLQPASIAYDGLLPSTAFAYVIGLAPRRLFLVPSGPLGELMIDPGTASVTFGVLDATGHFSLGFVPVSLLGTALLQVPLHAQAATLDLANNTWRMSNCDIHRYGL